MQPNPFTLGLTLLGIAYAIVGIIARAHGQQALMLLPEQEAQPSGTHD